jgi:hypothetical protein
MPARFFGVSTATGDSQRRAPSTAWGAERFDAGLTLLASGYSTKSGKNGVKWPWRAMKLRRADGRYQSRTPPTSAISACISAPPAIMWSTSSFVTSPFANVPSDLPRFSSVKLSPIGYA